MDEKTFREFPDEIKKLFNIFKFEDKFPKIKGSASLRSQQYIGDYDFFIYIGEPNKNKLFNEISRILNKLIEDNNFYFIEMKIQTLDGDKKRYYYGDEFKKKDFMKIQNIDFIKIDILAFINYEFKEVSIIYKLGDSNDENDNEFIKNIKEDIKELKQEGSYYKILKRLYSIAKIKDDRKMINLLTRFFNSDVGKLYSRYSNIQAILLGLEYYKNDKDFNNRLKYNLKNLSLNSDELDAEVERIFKKINLKARNKLKVLPL